MKLQITVTVPDDWRDQTSDTGLLPGPYSDITGALYLVDGVEDVDTEEVPD